MALDFPIIDYHVHLSRDLDVEQAVALADERGMKFGIVEHPGTADGITDDDELRAYIRKLRSYPVFAGLQPMYVGWSAAFSAEAIAELDYVLMDADTVPLDDGSWLSIWRRDNFIADMDAFVDRYLAHIENVLTNEPINIFARPTYLPINFARHYDDIWTEARMRMIIDVAKARHIALEIAENVRVPNLRFIQMAKDAGVKFTFGTNARNQNAGNFRYCIEMAAKTGLKREDMLVIG